MEELGLRSEMRKVGSHRGAAECVQCRDQDIWREVIGPSRAGPAQAFKAFGASLNARLLPVLVVLELFAGSCRWSRAASLRGEFVISIDIRFGQGHDLTSRKLQNPVLGWLQAGFVKFVLAGFPCQSFSRARNIPGGAPPLRDGDHIKGYPDLRPADQKKVDIGNACLAFVCRLVRMMLVTLTPGVVENPWTSWAWRMPAMIAVLCRKSVRMSRADFCQYGMPWRKATGFLTVLCDPSGIERQCSGRGKCSRTGRPHVTLKGTVNGIFLTHLAEPYPRTLCGRLVQMLKNAVLRQQSERLDQVFCKLC